MAGDDMNWDYLYKILLIGDTSVGKSSIFIRFTDDCFAETFSSTIGVDFKIRTLKVKDKVCKLQIWDTAGQERFRAITESYFRSANGILIVFDLTNNKSFESVKDWHAAIATRQEIDQSTALLIGNKVDLIEHRIVPKETAVQFAESLKLEYIETSAKENSNVQLAFIKLVESLLDKEAASATTNQNSRKVHGLSLNDSKPVSDKGSGCSC